MDGRWEIFQNADPLINYVCEENDLECRYEKVVNSSLYYTVLCDFTRCAINATTVANSEEVVVVVCVIMSGSCSVAAPGPASYTSLKVFFERTNYSFVFVLSFLISFFLLLRFFRIPSDPFGSMGVFLPCTKLHTCDLFRCAARETDRIEAQNACQIMHGYTFYMELHCSIYKAALLSSLFFFFFFFPCY